MKIEMKAVALLEEKNGIYTFGVYAGSELMKCVTNDETAASEIMNAMEENKPLEASLYLPTVPTLTYKWKRKEQKK